MKRPCSEVTLGARENMAAKEVRSTIGSRLSHTKSHPATRKRAQHKGAFGFRGFWKGAGALDGSSGSKLGIIFPPTPCVDGRTKEDKQSERERR